MTPGGRKYLSTSEMVLGFRKKTHDPIPHIAIPGDFRVYRPTKHDVLCGRGKPIQDHSGNLRMRRIVAQHAHLYLNARKQKKQEIVEQVVELVKNSEGILARFLKRVGRENYWVEVPDAVAIDKVSHGLRCLVRKSEAGELLEGSAASTSSTYADDQELDEASKFHVTGDKSETSRFITPTALSCPPGTLKVISPPLPPMECGDNRPALSNVAASLLLAAGRKHNVPAQTTTPPVVAGVNEILTARLLGVAPTPSSSTISAADLFQTQLALTQLSKAQVLDLWARERVAHELVMSAQQQQRDSQCAVMAAEEQQRKEQLALLADQLLKQQQKQRQDDANKLTLALLAVAASGGRNCFISC